MRKQAIELQNEGRYEPSWSEATDPLTGTTRRFYKEGVSACEPDGADFQTAPDLLTYMSVLITNIPGFLNSVVPGLHLSNKGFNAKLAVTSPGGSVYPLHVDNTLGLGFGSKQDLRKLTCILYLNPSYEETTDGGELQLLTVGSRKVKVFPNGGRLLMFWSDEIPHEVLPTGVGEREKDRYALTIWLPVLESEEGFGNM